MNGFRITLKDGAFVDTDTDGRIVRDYDPTSSRDYRCEPRDAWKIVGITKRFHSRDVATLSDCAHDASYIGQGWIHDIDHGTRREWCSPKHRRATRVTYITDAGKR